MGGGSGSAGGERRLAVLAEGQFSFHHGKTAMGVIRYGKDPVVAVIDSTNAARSVAEYLGPRFDIPIVDSFDDALALRPTALLIGIAPTGGRLPAEWRQVIRTAIDAGLDILSGLHTFIGDDPGFGQRRRDEKHERAVRELPRRHVHAPVAAG